MEGFGERLVSPNAIPKRNVFLPRKSPYFKALPLIPRNRALCIHKTWKIANALFYTLRNLFLIAFYYFVKPCPFICFFDILINILWQKLQKALKQFLLQTNVNILFVNPSKINFTSFYFDTVFHLYGLLIYFTNFIQQSYIIKNFFIETILY